MNNQINHDPAKDFGFTISPAESAITEDTEGHRQVRVEDADEDTEGHRQVRVEDADDTEGHRFVR